MRGHALFCRRYLSVIKALLVLVLALSSSLAAAIYALNKSRETNAQALAALTEAVASMNEAVSSAEDAWEEVRKLQAEVSSIKALNEALLDKGRTFIAEVTAYTPYAESTGKNPGHPAFMVTRSGWVAGFGVCAADTRYWPFGTILYVQGYGFCRVVDTGGAIKGKNRLDVFIWFPGDPEKSVELARKWGRRKVKVYVVQVPGR